MDFLARSQIQQQGTVSVSAAVLSAEESKQVFGVDLYKNAIQPVWLQFINKDSGPMILLPTSLDPEYFTPLEAAAAVYRFGAAKDNAALDSLFAKHGLEIFLPPGETRSGFVFTNRDAGTKGIVVELIGTDQEFRSFTFFIDVPGLRVDHHNVNFRDLHAADEIAQFSGIEESCASAALAKNNPSSTLARRSNRWITNWQSLDDANPNKLHEAELRITASPSQNP